MKKLNIKMIKNVFLMMFASLFLAFTSCDNIYDALGMGEEDEWEETDDGLQYVSISGKVSIPTNISGAVVINTTATLTLKDGTKLNPNATANARNNPVANRDLAYCTSDNGSVAIVLGKTYKIGASDTELLIKFRFAKTPTFTANDYITFTFNKDKNNSQINVLCDPEGKTTNFTYVVKAGDIFNF